MSRTALGLERLERLIAVGRGLLAELDLEVVLNRVLETAREVTGARYAALGILDEDRREIEQLLVSGIDARVRRTIGELPHGRGVLGLLIEDPRPVRLDDLASHPSFSGFPTGHLAMRSFLGVPILIRGTAWGNLYLTEKAEGAFTQEDEDALAVLADWAAIAIENARLYRTADAAVRGFEATAEIALAVGGETDLDRILQLLVDRGRALIEASALLVLLVDGDELVVAAGAGQTDVPRQSRLPVSESRSGEVLRTGRPLRTTDVARDLRVEPADLGVPDATAALLIPFAYRGVALGVLAAFDRRTGDVRFSADDENVLTSFAASAATAVATAKTVEADRLRRTIEAAEAERRRWARELHDETLQGLAGLKVLLLSGISRLDDREAIEGTMRQAVDAVSREIENLRAIVTDLRPAALDQLGLLPALRSLARRTSSLHALDIVTDFAPGDDGQRLPPELETTAYRLVQEALTNVVKHARASRVEIAAHAQDGTLEIRVADDGRGFDTDAASAGFGLVGMRERVELAGGQLRIESGPTGTEVRSRLPAPAPRKA
ncbi:MAG TPA: GAF domain-containing sensor histidine kinase [Solirubrobacter sp.]|nr:GAF domain-containing sensor histidine kinase [Solirubrobacter sp.]